MSEGVPVTAEDLANDADVPIEEVQAGLEAFKSQRMMEEVDGVYHLINWNRRQFISDSSADRVKRCRENKQQKDETAMERYRNVTVTPPEAENREQIQITEPDPEEEGPPPASARS